jgi:hypothetical protein
MRASITAYSTAVGPSSLTKNRWTLVIKLCMSDPFVIKGTNSREGLMRLHQQSD